ncbi:MAG: ABC transporter permease [Verrucomicrobiales bacterium]
MPFSLFLALRYLKPKRSVISVITLFCVAGVMLGVAALVVVMSVINGIQNKVREELLTFEPHIVAIEHPLPDEVSNDARPNWRAVAAELRTLKPDVTAVSPVIEVPGTVKLQRQDGSSLLEPVQLNAVDPETAGLESKLRIVEGVADLEGDNALISEAMANKWNVYVGQTITVQSFRNAEEAYRMLDEWEKTPKEERGEADEWFEKMKQVVQPAELTVTGIFRTPQRFVPIFIPLHIGGEMMVKGDDIDYLGVTTPDALDVGRFRTAVERALPQHWTSETWRERNRAYFDAVESERGMLYVLLLLIMIVAAFCIIVTLATVAIHKRKEIGVVRALGSRLSQIIAVFVQQGIIVGFLGTVLGVLGGIVFLHFRMQIKALVSILFGVEILDPAIYGVSEIPSDVQVDDLMVICGISMIVSTLAGVFPAFMAAGQDPAKALRSE